MKQAEYYIVEVTSLKVTLYAFKHLDHALGFARRFEPEYPKTKCKIIPVANVGHVSYFDSDSIFIEPIEAEKK